MRTPMEIALDVVQERPVEALHLRIAEAITIERQHQAKLEAELAELNAWKQGRKGIEEYYEVKEQLSQAEARVKEQHDYWNQQTAFAAQKILGLERQLAQLQEENSRLHRDFDAETLAHKAVVDELAQLQLEAGSLREAIQRAANQIKRGEWNSYNSGTWTILDDALSQQTPLLYSAVVELVEACELMSGWDNVPAFRNSLSTLKKLMGREA